MLGVSHATSGAAVWIATTATLPYLSTAIHPMPAAAVVAGSIVVAGAALLPDVDHHSATIAHSVPIAGRVLAGAAGTLSGGHRHGFHAPVFLVAVWFASLWLGDWTHEVDGNDIATGAGLTVMALCCFGLKARKVVDSWPKAWLLGLLFAVVVLLLSPDGLTWLPWAVTLGYATHLVGDLLTTGGLPLTWPLNFKPPRWWRRTPVLRAVWRPGGNIAVPLLGDAGSRREKLLAGAMGAYVAYGTLVELARLLGA